MEQNFHNRLVGLLKRDSRLLDKNNHLLQKAIIDKAWKMDHQLIALLLQDHQVKSKFFNKVSDSLVFNTNAFIDYMSDKNFLSNSYTRFRNKIGLKLGDRPFKATKDISLVWPYKDCVLEGGQTKEDTKNQREIFFNEILAEDEINRFFDPKVLTYWKRHTPSATKKVKEIQRDDNEIITENLIIKGNNLSTLHTLKSQFHNKIKLIYIDPPFNTKGDANTFLYNNEFNHSHWLTFMKNRLDIAKELLSDNGIIVIAIDHEELLYLGVLADEIFSRENRIGIISVQTNPGGRSDSKFFATSSEFFLVYAKEKELASIHSLPLTEDQKNSFKEKDEVSSYRWSPFRRGGSNSTPDDRPNLFYSIFYNENTGDISLKKSKGATEIIPLDSDGNKRVWRQSQERFKEAVKNNEIKIKKNKSHNFIVQLKDRIKEGQRPKTIWMDSRYDASSHGTKILKEIFNKNNIFSYPKSKHLIKDIIRITTTHNDIILDFFAGSGTTAEAVLELNLEDQGDRKFILCEQMDYINTVTIPRVLHTIKKSQKGDFISCQLMKYNATYIDKIQDAKSTDELLNLWKDISKNSFLNWYVNHKRPEEAIKDFIQAGREQGIEEQKKLLMELLNKNQLYVHLSEIEDEDFQVSEEDKALNKSFFQIQDDTEDDDDENNEN